jgi:hypothetical protein
MLYRRQYHSMRKTNYSLSRIILYLKFMVGLALAQAVSSRLPTAAPRVRAQVTLCGICGGQRGHGEDFLRVLRFPLAFIPPLMIIHHPAADALSGLSLALPQETKKKKKYHLVILSCSLKHLM